MIKAIIFCLIVQYSLAVQFNTIISIKPCMEVCYLYSPLTIILCLSGFYPSIPGCFTCAGAAVIACMKRCGYHDDYTLTNSIMY